MTRRPTLLESHRDRILSWLEQEPELPLRTLTERLGSDAEQLSESTLRRYLGTLRQELAAASDDPGRHTSGHTPPDPTPLPEPDTDGVHHLDDPAYYLSRELTWLNFNHRVLHEASDPRTPLLDRVRFLSIVNANIDEFFMKRIGGLMQQVGAGVRDRSVDGRTPHEQIDVCHDAVRRLGELQHEAFNRLVEQLEPHDIALCDWSSLSAPQRAILREHYIENIYPLVTPQATDPAHPFPFVSNLSLNLLVTVRYPESTQSSLARVKVPISAGIPRFLRVGKSRRFVPMESLMAGNLDLLFPGMVVESCSLFRVTRNANTEQNEEQADDLLALIESELRERKFAQVVRLEVEPGMGPHLRGMLASEMGLDETINVFEVRGMLSMRDLSELADISDSDLHAPAHHPVDHPALTPERNIFHVIRDAGAILLQHPYQSFSSSVERLLREAARDPKVRAIKMCLYRTSTGSKAIDYLIEAAQNGKQVAVVMEIKARFDEAANIRWANHMEEVGIHVTYGVVGLKTHCKVLMVVRQDYNGLRRYVHIGTGNYHSGTARLYYDVGLITCDPQIGADLTELFNYLTTGYKPKRRYNKILPAPKALKSALLARIEMEVEHHRAGRGGLVRMKLNALEDPQIVRALYRASQAGVVIELIVRDTCRLRPGVPGLSETVRVTSIVGRFLEHARIYHFGNGGEDNWYIGSADAMSRNLNSRVEVLCPVDSPALCDELKLMFDAQLSDARGAWIMQPDGSYVLRCPTGKGRAVSSQQVLIERHEREKKDAKRLKRRRANGPKRNL
ncbi:MAG: polyphosphate kinase 1 [Planctomycetota bacterium]|nr:MAG: polyphosphate kinase 1 [Planctomycetota bacterium]